MLAEPPWQVIVKAEALSISNDVANLVTVKPKECVVLKLSICVFNEVNRLS